MYHNCANSKKTQRSDVYAFLTHSNVIWYLLFLSVPKMNSLSANNNRYILLVTNQNWCDIFRVGCGSGKELYWYTTYWKIVPFFLLLPSIVNDVRFVTLFQPMSFIMNNAQAKLTFFQSFKIGHCTITSDYTYMLFVNLATNVWPPKMYTYF